MIKELNLLIAILILQGHMCNANNQSLHIFTVTVFFLLVLHLQNNNAVYSKHLESFLLNKYKTVIWVCHDLVRTKMDSRQRKKRLKMSQGISSSSYILFLLLNPLKGGIIVIS